jgi:hypothetical protein
MRTARSRTRSALRGDGNGGPLLFRTYDTARHRREVAHNTETASVPVNLEGMSNLLTRFSCPYKIIRSIRGRSAGQLMTEVFTCSICKSQRSPLGRGLLDAALRFTAIGLASCLANPKSDGQFRGP